MKASTRSAHPTLLARPRRRRPRLRGVILSLAALSILIGGFLYWRDLPPTVSIPPQVIPTPNARDYFVRAAALERDSRVFFANRKSSDPAPSPAEIRAAVRENIPTLAALREGLQYTYTEPRPGRGGLDLTPLAKFRESARFLSFLSSVDASRGDWSGAVRVDLDCVQMGEKINRGGPVICSLVAYAVEAIGEYHFWIDTTHLTAAQAHSAARRLQGIVAARAPYSAVLQEEEYRTERSFVEAFAHPRWRTTSNEVFDVDMGDFKDNALLQFYSKRQILRDYQTGMNELIANSRLPYALHHPRVRTSDPISEEELSIIEPCTYFDVRDLADEQLFLAALGIQGYTRDHQHPPARLQDLVPAYLPAVPQDPFALNQPLRYRVESGRPILYSIGPDGKDNGGRTPLSFNTDGRPTTGDILAWPKPWPRV